MNLPDITASPNVIFGYHPIREALLQERTRIEKIYISEGRRDSRLGDLLDEARRRGIPITRLGSPLFRKVFGVKGVQSIAAQVAVRPMEEMETLLESATPTSLFVVVDEVLDPRNLGSIFRSAAAAGVDGIFLPSRRIAPISAVVEKTSAGAVNHVRAAHAGNLVNLTRDLNEMEIQTIALVPGAPRSYLDCDYRGATALVVGGEERGVRRLLRETCLLTASIPMSGNLDSLNVSVALAVVLFEALRQRRAAQSKSERDQQS